MTDDQVIARIFETMARASVGDTAARVDLAGAEDFDRPLVRLGHTLNVLLGDIGFRHAEAQAATLRANEEQARRLREVEREAQLLDLGDPFMELDASQRVLRINANLEALMRRPRSEIEGRLWSELWPDASDPDSSFRREVDRCMRDRVAVQFEAPCEPLADWVSVAAFPTADEGSVAFIRDVSEQRRVADALDASSEALRKSEDQLRQAQKMEAVGRLAGGIAHDFNNLLMVILGVTELVRSRLKPEDPHKKQLQEVLSAVERAGDLTRSLLAFSRRQVLQPTATNLNRVIERLGSMLQRILGEDITLSLQLADELGTCMVDRAKIELVLMNLVVNARSAMPDGGELRIETADVHVGSADVRSRVGLSAGSHVRIRVVDTGVGIDEAILPHIFEPFFTTRDSTTGTGLGLSTVFGIVTQSNGHVGVSSEPGRGATFEIHLPRIETPADPLTATPTTPQPAGGTETILVVEDDVMVRSVLVTALRHYGYVVFEAQNAGEAYLIADKHPSRIHLLLTDVVMPRVNGIELARQLTQKRSDMALIFISGYAPDLVDRVGQSPRDTHFLTKPIRPIELARKVREVLDAAVPSS